LNVVHYFLRVSEASGGVSRAIYDLVSLMAAVGHEVALATAADSRFPQAWFTSGRGTPEIVTFKPPPKPFELLSRASLAKIGSSLQEAEMLHLHGLWRPSSSQVAGLARRLRKPYVMTIHGTLDDWSMRQRPVRKRIYHRLFEMRNLAAAGRIHATAWAEAEQARKWIPHGRIAVIPYAFDLAPFAQPPGRELFLAAHPEVDARRTTVLFLSRLHPKKGAEILIRAVGMVRRTGVDCQLLMAGPGKASYLNRLRQLAASHVPDALFLGMVTGEEKHALYRFADVLALPTSQENFGLVFTESLACGTPVVTTRGTDIWSELESSGGALIAEPTAEAFAVAIVTLLSDSQRRQRMGRDGRRWVFDWLERRKVVDRYERLYREAAANGIGRTGA